MTITAKAMEWRDKVAEELSFATVGVAPTRTKAQLDYAHLIIGQINIEIIYKQTMTLPATDERPNELEWTEPGWVVVYTGEDNDASPLTVNIHPEENWTDEKLLEVILSAYWFVSE